MVASSLAFQSSYKSQREFTSGSLFSRDISLHIMDQEFRYKIRKGTSGYTSLSLTLTAGSASLLYLRIWFSCVFIWGASNKEKTKRRYLEKVERSVNSLGTVASLIHCLQTSHLFSFNGVNNENRSFEVHFSHYLRSRWVSYKLSVIFCLSLLPYGPNLFLPVVYTIHQCILSVVSLKERSGASDPIKIN